MSKEMLEDLIIEFDEMGFEPSITLCPNRIEEINSFGRRLKNVLLTFQEQEKVLKIIKEKKVDIIAIKESKTLEEYNRNAWEVENYGRYKGYKLQLTQEEFILLKRYLNDTR